MEDLFEWDLGEPVEPAEPKADPDKLPMPEPLPEPEPEPEPEPVVTEQAEASAPPEQPKSAEAFEAPEPAVATGMPEMPSAPQTLYGPEAAAAEAPATPEVILAIVPTQRDANRATVRVGKAPEEGEVAVGAAWGIGTMTRLPRRIAIIMRGAPPMPMPKPPRKTPVEGSGRLLSGGPAPRYVMGM